MMLPLIGIVSERRFQWGSHHRVWLRNEKVIMKTVCSLFLNCSPAHLFSNYCCFTVMNFAHFKSCPRIFGGYRMPSCFLQGYPVWPYLWEIQHGHDCHGDIPRVFRAIHRWRPASCDTAHRDEGFCDALRAETDVGERRGMHRTYGRSQSWHSSCEFGSMHVSKSSSQNQTL